VVVADDGPTLLTEPRVSILSPWPEVAQASSCANVPIRFQPGEQATLTIQLAAPANPERELLPFWVELTGQARGREVRGTAFTRSIALDMVLKSPLSVEVSPTRVFRGEESKACLLIRNSMPQPARGSIRIGPHPKIEALPVQLPFDVPASGEQKLEVTFKVKLDAHLGDTHLPFATTSEDARLRTQGTVTVIVSVPVPRVSIPRLKQKPVIDGDLSDAAWQSPPTIPEFKALRTGGAVSEQTAVWVAYDNEGLYVALRCVESNMPSLKAEFTTRGSPLYKEDDVEFFLLPISQTSALQFAINPLGTQSDNFGDRSPWKAAGKKLDGAWTVEAFVPYSCLKAQAMPAPGTEWSAQFGRQQKAKFETSAWTTGAAFNSPANFGILVFGQ
jgi:hypothetical protein